MRRGYTATTQNRDRWEDNDASDYSQDEEFSQPVQHRSSSRSRPHETSPPPRRASFANKEKPSGIPRPGGNTSSRLPSALKTPRSRAYSSSSSTESHITNEDIIPPVPQITVDRGRSGKNKTNTQEPVARSEDTHVSHVGLSRRPTSVSRSRSRSYSRSGTNVPEPHPPPLPGSDSYGNDSPEHHFSQESERTPNPKRSSWAKDRRRFADPTPSTRDTSEASRYDQPPAPVASGRKASLKTPTNYRSPVTPNANAPPVPNRIPFTTKPAWVPIEEQYSSGYDETSQASSRSDSARGGHIQDDNSSTVASQGGIPRSRRMDEPVRVDFTKSSQVGIESAHAPPTTPSQSRRNRYSSAHSKIKPNDADDQEAPELVRISSMMDAPLPTPPLPQFDAAVRSRTPQTEHATVSSPVETLLMGSAPASATPNSRSMSTSTPNSKSTSRSARESSVYASITPNTRRLSEPSPGKGGHNSVAADQEAPPTIFQRLVRRASLSSGKSPKPGSTPKSPKTVSTPKNQMVVEHNAVDSPFGLEVETPRPGATNSSSEIRANHPERYKNRQSSIYLPHATTSEPKNPRLKVVEGESAKLGSPFMGDGSPKFGIDERFRSPKKRTKSGLRHDTFGESNEGRLQELHNYYGVTEAENTGDYLTEALPIATVLSSPDNASGEKTPRGQSKKRSQYQSTTRARAGTNVPNESENISSVSETPTGHRLQTPARSRTSSFVPPPTITQASAQPSAESSNCSQFSDSSDEPEVPTDSRSTSRARSHDREGRDNKSPEVTTLRRPRSTVRFAAHCENEFNQKTDRNACQSPSTLGPQLNNASQKSFQDDFNISGCRTNLKSDTPSVGQIAKRTSQLPVPRQRKTNSALFRALEQPYESSSSIVASVDSSSGLTQTSSDGGLNSDYVSTGNSVEGLHAVSSNLSSLNGESVGDIRWSTGENGNKGFDKTVQALLKNVGESKGGSFEEVQLAANDPTEVRRQQIVWDFCDSEADFVDTLQGLVQLFVQPLRAENQREWIAGLAPDIMRLFDWLDDIANLHEQLLVALESSQQERNSVLGFCETIKGFIPLMELYQPYLVRVDEVGKMISSMALDPESDFGEFVRIQSEQLAYEDNFEDMLKQPLVRLQGYATTFRELLEVTPLTHADYLATFSLFYSMDATIRILEEVKMREEEYDMVKNLLKRIRGLPSGSTLATRNRRLLAQGLLSQILIDSNEQLGAERPVILRQPGGRNGARIRARSGSNSTTAYSTTDSTASSYSSTPSATAHSGGSDTDGSMRPDSSATSSISAPFENRHVKSRFDPRSNVTSPRPSVSQGPQRSQIGSRGETNIYALVFTDCLVLARPIKDTLDPFRSPRKPQQKQLDILESLGVFWLLNVTDCTDRCGNNQILSLDIVPIGGHTPDDIRPPVFVAVPCLNETLKAGTQVAQRAHQEWSQALHHCYSNTLRSLAFTSQPKAPVLSSQGNTPPLCLATDTVASDSRFPKSPSQQLEYEIERRRAKLQPTNNAEDEREERMFWSERFRVVSEEIQRTYEGPRPTTAAMHQEPKATGVTNNGRFRSSNTYI